MHTNLILSRLLLLCHVYLFLWSFLCPVYGFMHSDRGFPRRETPKNSYIPFVCVCTRLEHCLLNIYLSLRFHPIDNILLISFMEGGACVVIPFQPFFLAFRGKKEYAIPLKMDKWRVFRLSSRNFTVLVWSLVCEQCL